MGHVFWCQYVYSFFHLFMFFLLLHQAKQGQCSNTWVTACHWKSSLWEFLWVYDIFVNKHLKWTSDKMLTEGCSELECNWSYFICMCFQGNWASSVYYAKCILFCLFPVVIPVIGLVTFYAAAVLSPRWRRGSPETRQSFFYLGS